MKKLTPEDVDKIIDSFLDDFPYGYWDGVCSCCTGFENTENAMKEHFRKELNKLLTPPRVIK